MASAALTSLLQTLKQIPQPAEQPFESLQEKVSRLLLILEDSSRNNRTIDHLEGQIRDASYEVEYIVESRISTQALSKSKNSFGVMSCFWEMISAIHLCERPVEYKDQDMDLQYFQGLQKRIDEFDTILKTLPKMNFSARAASSRFSDNSQSIMVGRDEDLMRVQDRLTGYQSKLDIIPIVGMGGIGKTTLARKVYNDGLIDHHFQTRGWIVVSQNYSVRKMLMGVLNSTIHSRDELHHSSIEQLGEQLYKSLKGRRYLVVMDDIWDTRAWDEVKRFFPDDDNGSRIIFTTRLEPVAMYFGSHIHHMSFLSSEESWQLLRQKAFDQEENYPSALEEIGNEIAQDCKGLPLAIVLIGGILSKGSKTGDYWEYIAENVNFVVTGNDDQFTDILSLSYNSLPHHLKPCFLYMGVFPEDHEILVSRLLKIWIAEGLVKPLTLKSLEEVAEDYLKDLIDRNLIMVQKTNHSGEIKACIIHDVFRDLCVKIAHDEKFLQIIYSDNQVFPEGKTDHIRVSIHSNTLVHLADVHDSYIRTLLYFSRHFSNSQVLSIIMSCRLLRVLDALTVMFYKFPDEILELVHLRYLALLYEGTDSFPASISKLQDLQTLIVYRGDIVALIGKSTTIYLPSTIREMPQLRHLLLERSLLPANIIGKDSVILENLQTLSGITNFRCSVEVLKMMPNLKKLGISYFYVDDTTWSSYEFHNLAHLHQLETLKCHFIGNPVPVRAVRFSFPHFLRKLTLSGCRMAWEEMTIVGSLPFLEVLQLKDHAFKGSTWEPTEGEFLNLMFLLIEDTDLRHWWAEYTHFPRLQHLSLRFCGNLEEIPAEIGEIPTLETIELYRCCDSAGASALRIQEEQRDMGNYDLRVSVNPSPDYY